MDWLRGVKEIDMEIKNCSECDSIIDTTDWSATCPVCTLRNEMEDTIQELCDRVEDLESEE